MFRFRVVFTPSDIIFVIIVTIIAMNGDGLWISFFRFYKSKNDSPLSHWRKEQVHLCNIYKFGITDICECIKVVNFLFLCICKDKNNCTLFHWSKDQIHFHHIYTLSAILFKSFINTFHTVRSRIMSIVDFTWHCYTLDILCW